MTPEELAYIDLRIDAKMELIAELAAKKAIEHVYAEIGAGVLRKAAWILGVGLIALFTWLAGTARIVKP